MACLNSPSGAGEVLKAPEWLFISTQFQPEPLEMSAHAFDGAPTQGAFISSRLKQIESRGVFGLRDQWDVPAALWCAPTGFDARYPEDGHATISMVLGGEPVERLDGRFSGRSGGPEPDLFMLYPGGDVFDKPGMV